MKEKNVYVSGGIGFTGLLTICFIVLKLCNVIQWPWIWVVSPIWISFVVVVVFFLIIIVLSILLYYLL